MRMVCVLVWYVSEHREPRLPVERHLRHSINYVPQATSRYCLFSIK